MVRVPVAQRKGLTRDELFRFVIMAVIRLYDHSNRLYIDNCHGIGNNIVNNTTVM